MDLSSSTPPATAIHTVVVGVARKESKISSQKLRLMVSYNGHILPRPHDKALFYAGGETRIISIPRNTSLSLSSLFSHISKSLLNGSHNFLLKYQLPNHDLDSLISVSSDEDFCNMVDEYDRLSSSASPTSSRIRFFLFRTEEPVRDLKSDDDWFVDALKVAGSNPVDDSSSSPESIVLESSSSFGSNASSSNSPGKNKLSVADDFKVVLPSLDSLGSDCSLPSPNFSQQAIVYQDASGFFDSKPVSVNLVETESNPSDRSPRSDILTPVQVSGYLISKPMDQQQHQSPSPQPTLATATPHYIHYPASQSNYIPQYYPNPIPVASYAPMYQPYVPPQQPVQYQLNKPYPVYMMPMGQTRNLYDASMPHTLTTAPNVARSQPQMPSNPVMVSSPMVYEGYSKPEYAAEVYMPTSVSNQSMTMPPVHQSAQPVTVPPLENTNYISEYEDPMHAQIYKTQPSGLTLPSQLQMATSAATDILPESFTQLQVENSKH
ncbi:hypothetical protein SOVF_130670 [Spinacia oleracea]|uniref:PB1 domain-containing protein n=1 Tax=Spinacia oleracea TaxID=3562 RepID=A0A9R0JA18_SPIOL|nr:uncharacterized protein LOC110801604 [Spinacia oleracea]KNA11928.1 hypothetical protein SOVF_130670 [Spinacia oleracea]